MPPNLKYPKNFSNLAGALQAAIAKDEESNLKDDDAGAAVENQEEQQQQQGYPPLTSSTTTTMGSTATSNTGGSAENPLLVAVGSCVFNVGTSNENAINNFNNDDDEYFHEDIEAYEPLSSPTIEVPEQDGNAEIRLNNRSCLNKKSSTSSSSSLQQRREEASTGSRSKQARKFIKKLSSIVRHPDELNIDQQRLCNAAADVGSSAYGIQAISVWLFDDETDRLCPTEGGWWHDQSSLGESVALARLVDATRDDYVPPVSVSPGVDIAGLLWLESNKFERVASMITRSRVSSMNQLVAAASHSSLNGGTGAAATEKNETLIWRDLKSLVEDPDTAKGPRLALLHQAGIGQATGITFQTELQSGMVVFFAKKNLDPEILHGHANFAYLKQAARYIGGAAAMAEARRALLGQQIEKGFVIPRYHGEQRGSDTIGSDIEGGGGTPPNKSFTIQVESQKEEKNIDQGEGSGGNHCNYEVPRRMKVWLNKAKGGGLQIPPSLSFRQSLWTAFGAFCGLLVLSALNEYYQYLSDGDYALLIGPFGALMTLQYGLTAAPASQPRNAILGQAVTGAVSMAFTYIPEEILPVWIRRAVGPAIAIATMVKCGFTHPPAGAHAVLYASGQYNFVFYALVVFSTAVSVIPATLVNNMSIKRQYPTYWGFSMPVWITDIFEAWNDTKHKEEDGKKNEDGIANTIS